MTDTVVVPTIAPPASTTLSSIAVSPSVEKPEFPRLATFTGTWREEVMQGPYEGRDTGLAFCFVRVHGIHGVLHKTPIGAEVLAHVSAISVPLTLSFGTVVGEVTGFGFDIDTCVKKIDIYASVRHSENFASVFWDGRSWTGTRRDKTQTWETSYTSDRTASVVTLTTTLQKEYTESVSVGATKKRLEELKSNEVRTEAEQAEMDNSFLLLQRTLNSSEFSEVTKIMGRIIKTNTMTDETVDAVFPLISAQSVSQEICEQLLVDKLMPSAIKEINASPPQGQQSSLSINENENENEKPVAGFIYNPQFADSENWKSLGIPDLLRDELGRKKGDKQRFIGEASDLHIRQVTLQAPHLQVWRSAPSKDEEAQANYTQVQVQDIEQYTAWNKNHGTYVSQKASSTLFFGESPKINSYLFEMKIEEEKEKKYPLISHVLRNKAQFSINLPNLKSVFEIKFGNQNDKEGASFKIEAEKITGTAPQIKIESEEKTTFRASEKITIEGQKGKDVTFNLTAVNGVAMLGISSK